MATTAIPTPTALVKALGQIDGWIGGSQGVAGAGAAICRGGRLVAERDAGGGRPGAAGGRGNVLGLALWG